MKEIIYHEGNLSNNRSIKPGVDSIANHWWEEYERGGCSLVQKKIPFTDDEILAQTRRRRFQYIARIHGES